MSVFLVSCGVSAPQRTESAASMRGVSDYVFLLFFEWDRAELDERAQNVVRSAARALGTAVRPGTTRIEVLAHTDLSGSPAYNQRLSQRRGEAVAAELVRNGVPPDRISITAFGKMRPLAHTKDGQREAQNRRVEIVHR